ncbi:MAG: hypothetical protein ACREUD_00965 [Gammaproteobacteria bacterium]
MAEQANIPELERITFFNGQRLTARDLSELQRAHRELGWLHNRSLHGWGIGIGLAVTGERGATAVTVDPGYGVDCLGREIILTDPRTVPVPADPGASEGNDSIYYLVAAYQPDEDQAIAERRPGVCLPEGTVRLSETPRIEWRRPEQLSEGFELILAQAGIRNCRLSRPLSLTARRYARPAQQPYIAAGQTQQGKTGWLEWKAGEQTLGVYAEVNTSAARFGGTPQYFAHVPGDRHVVAGSGQILVLMRTTAGVIAATPTGFTLQLRIHIEQSSIAIADLAGFVEGLNWYVVWMGIEA